MELEESRRVLSDLQVSDLHHTLEALGPLAEPESFHSLDSLFPEESVGWGPSSCCRLFVQWRTSCTR